VVEKRNVYRVLMAKSERKSSLGIPRNRWVDNIKTDLREIRLDRSGSEYGPVEGSC
jgi:hypothetical protein